VEAKELQVQHIAGEHNPADIFTKPLLQERHTKLCHMLGLLPPPSGSKGCVADRPISG
jgi:hypothetical protein